MSQRAFEAALGKLICDDAFRRDFFADPETAATRAGFELTPVEKTSLRKIDPDAIEVFVMCVDDRVRRAEEPAAQRVPGVADRRRLKRSRGRSF